MPTCEAPRLTVSKNTRSPGCTSRGSIALPDAILLAHLARQRRCRAARTPTARTRCNRTLTDRCRRCGTACPCSVSAVATTTRRRDRVTAGTTSGGPTGAGRDGRRWQRSAGKRTRRGVPPVVAQRGRADGDQHDDDESQPARGQPSNGSCNASHCNRRNPLSLLSLYGVTRILDSSGRRPASCPAVWSRRSF